MTTHTQARLNKFVPLIVTLFSGQIDENSKLGRLFFVEHNAKMNTAMYKMVLQKHLKASMKMTGTWPAPSPPGSRMVSGFWTGLVSVVTSTRLRISGGSSSKSSLVGGRYKPERSRYEDLLRQEDPRAEEGVPLRHHLLHAQPRGGGAGRWGWHQQVLSLAQNVKTIWQIMPVFVIYVIYLKKIHVCEPDVHLLSMCVRLWLHSILMLMLKLLQVRSQCTASYISCKWCSKLSPVYNKQALRRSLGSCSVYRA